MNKIAAVIVTYNRVELLKKCVEAIRLQHERPVGIIVINNGSTDSTKEWLNKQNDIVTVDQENSGSAGGFYTGIQKAFEDGYDWLWLMDDDGIPDSNCLQILLTSALDRNAYYAAPNLIDFSGKSHFQLKFEAAPDTIIYGRGGPFNGILIHRKIIEHIGFPNRKFFIWGDEYEYTDRVIEKGFVMLLVKDAIHYHKITKFPLHKCPRTYHFVRNRFWRFRSLKGINIKRNWLGYEALDHSTRLFFQGLIHFNLSQVKDVIKGMWHGLFKDFKDE